MKAIMVMFDSLNRHMLPPYGCEWVHAPNFRRLAQRSVTFDSAYVGSMPCIPARRELHTGRYNFLHRSWGPIEPFDDSMPALLDDAGIHAHLVSDHYHYWEDGGATYHNRYSTWEAVRGQEGDFWKGLVDNPPIPDHVDIFANMTPVPPNARKAWRQDWVNRGHMKSEQEQPQSVTFSLALEFLERNHTSDGWFLQVETFDPHEPFFTMQDYKDLYPDGYDGPHFDWPKGGPAGNDSGLLKHARYQYAALVSMCDAQLGRILDAMDQYGLWEDTMLIVNTDHGFLLGEHEYLGKGKMPWYEELSHIPLFIWDPRSGVAGTRRYSLVQTIDLAPTLLDFFGLDVPSDMQGVPLGDVIRRDKPPREYALFGMFGGQVNCTDGRYVCMRGSVSEDNQALAEYTLMPTSMLRPFPVEAFHNMELQAPFTFTKGARLMRIPTQRPPAKTRELKWGNLLFDLDADPGQQHPVKDRAVERRMCSAMVSLMEETDAPREQYTRLGLS